jgi:uncharacterized protein
MEILQDTVLLFLLGVCGWGLFSLLRLPAAPVLGTLTLIGALRITGYPLPPSPDYIFLVVQILLGCYAGTKITRETVGELKTMVAPATMIVVWALSMVFVMGGLLMFTTSLDLHTSLLSSSMGGLPEMTVIALASGADVTVIVLIQTIRMVSTILVFPFIVKKWIDNGHEERDSHPLLPKDPEMQRLHFLPWIGGPLLREKEFIKKNLESLRDHPRRALHYCGYVLLTLSIAAGGGYIFLNLGVPAGAMIGAMLAVAAASLAGVPVRPLPGGMFNYMLIGVGIMVSGSISPDTVEILMAGSLLLPVLLSTVLSFLTALGVAFLIHRVVGWDYPTCFLAAAPGGFTVMTTLAIKYGRDPFRVSLLHLCRLIALKTVVPVVFMFLM